MRVLWAGLASDYFAVRNGVKQGGVISPILFCIYIDDLLKRLSLSDIGCYICMGFVGALASADDIVLILAPNLMLHANYSPFVMILLHNTI